MRILVTGLLTYESGKTEFISSLVSTLKNRGFKPGYFKPVAGHDGWYQYETIVNSIETKILIGHDAYVIGKKLDLLDILHVISPLDVLTLPVDLSKLFFNTYLYEEHMSSVFRRAVLARFTRIFRDINNYRNIYFVLRDNASRVSVELSKVLIHLMNSLSVENSLFIETNSSNFEKLLLKPVVYDIIDSYLDLLSRYEPVIIEGYNDVASPTRRSLHSDIVFVVSPSKVFAYSGSRYRTAVEFLSYRGYPWNIRVRSVLEVCGKPLKTFDIPLKIFSDESSKVFEEIVDFIYNISKQNSGG